MFDKLELLGITRYDTSGQLRNLEEVINEWIEKQDLLTWRVWHSLQLRNNKHWYYYCRNYFEPYTGREKWII